MKNQKKGNVIKDYVIIGDPIGEGSYGKVFLVQHLKSKNFYAAKMMKLDKIMERPDTKRKIVRELKILMKMSHPNIARLYDIVRTQKHIYFIIEYCDGENLQDVLQTNFMRFKDGFSQKIVQHLTRQIVQGLYKFSESKVIHRDLKLGNIMLCFDDFDYHSLNLNQNNNPKCEIFNRKEKVSTDMKFLNEMKVYETVDAKIANNAKLTVIYDRPIDNFFSYKMEHFESKENFEEILLKAKVKIIDLGFARELEENGTYSFCGTPSTIAPEIFHVAMNRNIELKYDDRVDLWSLGSIIFHLTNSAPPFISNDLVNLYKKILIGDFRISKNSNLSIEFLDLLNGLLQVNPDNRFSWKEILNHPFLNSSLDKLTFINLNEEEDILKLSKIFNEINFSEDPNFFTLNANKKFEFYKRYKYFKIENISEGEEEKYEISQSIEDYNIGTNKPYIEKQPNDKENNFIPQKWDIQGNRNHRDCEDYLNYEIQKKISFDDNKQKDYSQNKNTSPAREYNNNIKNNIKNDNVKIIEEINEEEISDSLIEEKLDFIIIEVSYEFYEDEEGFIVVTYDEKEL